MIRQKTVAIIFLVGLFFFVSAAVDFFHNHKTIQEPANCPAGQFLQVFLSTGISQVTFLILFILLKIINLISCHKYKELYVKTYLSRSPPLV